ncbi:hypothetical protein BDV26DRAFT_269255 [Aspergillus bertholletiae]|uniref:CENP-V/GFA domain-containing protein n=1 Tax=Aspergillus bertholletiae TaxID=1226010 RepID=A0A5N7B0I9_9EURO|nr:hypothetical protein BDV26DRAFT_269255 [Aspergillus bertholletiae]
MATSAQEHSSLPYHGSCHCGFIRYIAFIPLPPAVALGPDVATGSRARFYKCNCSTCHKMGLFHMRLPDAPSQFFLLSPLDRDTLANYKCFKRHVDWFFCPTCGVRCFSAVARWKQDEIDVKRFSAALSNSADKPNLPGIEESTKTVTVWRVNPDGYQEDVTGYLSINALTVDQDQAHGDPLDLRQLVDKKWVEYLGWKGPTLDSRYDYPHDSGTW